VAPRWEKVRLFVLAFVLGALGLQQAAALPQLPILPGALAALLCVRLVPARHRLARCALLLVAGGLAGYGIAASRADSLLAHSLPKAWEGEEIDLTGVVAGLPQLTESGTRFPFDVESVRTPRVAAGVPLTVPPTLALTWYAQRAKGDGDAIPPPLIVSGQRWRSSAISAHHALRRARSWLVSRVRKAAKKGFKSDHRV